MKVLNTSLWAVALVSALSLLGHRASAQTADYKFQAIFVSSFIRQIKWPDQGANQKFVVGVMRDARISSVFRQRFASSRNVEVKSVIGYDEIGDCDLLFIPVSTTVSYSRIRAAISDKSILLVTEKEGLIRQGSDINLVVVNNRLAFELNKKGMDRKKLKVSAYLTRLGILKD